MNSYEHYEKLDSEGRLIVDTMHYVQRSPGPSLWRITNNDKGRRRRCDVRIKGGHKGYTWYWCAGIARWRRGEQEVCDFHAGMIVGGTLPLGITQTGRWGNKATEQEAANG